MANSLRTDRVPGSLDEARTLVAYNERIRATSKSAQRVERAERMLANLRPHVERLERAEAGREVALSITTTVVRSGETLLDARSRLDEDASLLQRIAQSAPPVRSFDGRLQAWRDAKGDDDREYEVVWNGGEGLTSMGERRAR